ncbi:MAG: DUF2513 domain-containing protein [Collimonas pratensis]|uniref:DUF2513 domain-containing protein n=1 Tax=Collimonas pratensis TaxID=279113 RepID=UPI003C711817
MKRDWDLLRKQLTDIEEELDVFADLPIEPKWEGDERWEEFEPRDKEFRAIQARILGHLELLINSGYIDGVEVQRGADGHFSLGVSSPRLTMSGHDLLNTMRSTTIWESVKSTAKTKGIELTFEVIKALAGLALKKTIGVE